MSAQKGTRALGETDWSRWLRDVTRETSIRGIASATGVTHTTVRKWLLHGVPPDRAWSIAVKFRADPIELLVLLDRITPEQVGDLNYRAIVEYAPTTILTEELHKRATTVRRDHPNISLHKQRA